MRGRQWSAAFSLDFTGAEARTMSFMAVHALKRFAAVSSCSCGLGQQSAGSSLLTCIYMFKVCKRDQVKTIRFTAFQQYVAFMAAAFGLDLDAFEGDALSSKACETFCPAMFGHLCSFALQPSLLHHAGSFPSIPPSVNLPFAPSTCGWNLKGSCTVRSPVWEALCHRYDMGRVFPFKRRPLLQSAVAFILFSTMQQRTSTAVMQLQPPMLSLTSVR